MKILTPEKAIRDRCEALGLSLWKAERLAAQAHAGYPAQQSLLWVLGLEFESLAPLRSRNWIGMAARTCSVSYREAMTEKQLLAVLTTGEVPDKLIAHILHLLDEASVQLVVMAAEDAAKQSGITLSEIWGNIERLSAGFKGHRSEIWQVSR